MALSRKRTCLAVLRQETNLRAEALGELIGRSPDWMKKAESGKIPIPAEVARMIASVSGCHLDWILAGDVQDPCIDWRGRPYSMATWNEYRAKAAAERPDQLSAVNLPSWLPELAGVAFAAADKYALEVFQADLDAAVDRLRKKYGSNPVAAKDMMSTMSANPSPFVFVVAEQASDGRTAVDQSMADNIASMLSQGLFPKRIRRARAMQPQKQQPSRQGRKGSPKTKRTRPAGSPVRDSA